FQCLVCGRQRWGNRLAPQARGWVQGLLSVFDSVLWSEAFGSFPGAVSRSRSGRPGPGGGPTPSHAPQRSPLSSLSLGPHRIPGIRRCPIDGQLSPEGQRERDRLLHGTKNVTNSSSLRLPRQNSDGGQKNKPREHIIDCGDIVWSLAFGSSVPEKQSRCVNIEWHRFRFGQDQLLLATGLNNGRIKIWDVYTGKLLLNLVDHTEVVRDLTFAPDGSLILVSASRDKTLRVWDLKDDGNMMKVLRGHQNWVYSCAFSPDSSMLCSVGASKAVFLWNMDKYTMIRKLEGHHHDVVACDFSPDGALLATASYDTRVYIWDPHNGDILMEFGHLFPPPTPIFAGGANDRWVRSVSFSHDGLHIASLADDKMVRFWRIDEDYPVQVAPLSNGLCCAFSTDGSVLAAGTHDGSVYFWATPRQVPSLQHLCRMSIRRVMPTQEVQELPVPSKLLEFLSYRI
uniref:WD repeat and SOCS box-containing protein 1 n=1 Tax=Macaca fascicularis TaxID=9541 RepID=A0A2K5VD42_MACFA